MKRSWIIGVTIFFANFFSTTNACNFQTRNLNYDGNYSLVANPISLQVQMRRQNDINRDPRGFYCYLYSYGFDEGNAGSYNRYMENRHGDKLYYNIYKEDGFQNILKEIDDISSNAEAIYGYALSRNSWYYNAFDFNLVIDNSILVPSGRYEDNITIKLYSGFPFLFPELERTRNLRLRITVDPEIHISLVSVGANHDPNSTSYNMNFGVLETGETMAADLKVVANTPHKVYFESQNGNVLSHSTSSTAEIDYELFVNSTKVFLNQAGRRVEVVDSPTVTPAGGATYTIEAVIGDVLGKETGTYREVITITAEAN